MTCVRLLFLILMITWQCSRCRFVFPSCKRFSRPLHRRKFRFCFKHCPRIKPWTAVHCLSGFNNGNGSSPLSFSNGNAVSKSADVEDQKEEETIENESRRILEWDALCRQVVILMSYFLSSLESGFMFCINANGIERDLRQGATSVIILARN